MRTILAGLLTPPSPQVLRRIAVASVVTLAFVPSAASAGIRSLNRLVVIGDSYADGGNSGLLSIGALPPSGFPAPPYAGGRLSNGPVSVEQLWRSFNPTGPALKPSMAGGTNFAVVGATTGSASVLDVDPSFPTFLRPSYANTGGASQLQQALATTASDPDPNSSLYVVWLGANDGLYWFYTGGSPLGTLGSNTGSVLGGLPQPGKTAGQSISNAVQNVVTAVGSLIASGAKKILVPNLLDFGQSPLYNTDPQASAAVTQLTLGFNSGLSQGLKTLRASNPGVDIMEFDTYSLFNKVKANPTAYGFDNVSTRCVLANQTVDPACNPDRWFFWDRTHPTTAAHALIAEGMVAVVNDAANPQSVPGPLPVVGGAAAFGFSRRLRRRLLRR